MAWSALRIVTSRSRMAPLPIVTSGLIRTRVKFSTRRYDARNVVNALGKSE